MRKSSFQNAPILAYFQKVWNREILVYLGFSGAFLLLLVLDVESSIGRIYLYRVGLEIWLQNMWLGVGLGNLSHIFIDAQSYVLSLPFWAAYTYKATEVHQIHNEIFNAFIESGLVGGLLLFSSIVVAFKSCKTDFEKVFGLLLMVPIFVDAPLHVLPVSLLFYTWLGITSFETVSFEVTLEFPRKWVLGIATAVFILVSPFLISQIGDRYIGLKTWKIATEALQRQSWNTAKLHLQSTQKLLPHSIERDYQLLVSQWNVDRSTETLKDLENLVHKHSNRSRLITLGNCYLDSGRFDQAKEVFIKLSQAFPEHIAPHRYLAEVYYRINQLEEMNQHLQNAKMNYTKNPTSLNKRIMDELFEVIQI